MNTPIYHPKVFLKHFCKEAGIALFDPTDRACVIARSQSEYGRDGSVIIEWEGTPPRFRIYFGYGLIVEGKQIKEPRFEKAIPILRLFLDAHPANKDGSPVWIGMRLQDRRRQRTESNS